MASTATIVEGWRDGLRPDPDLTVSEWADLYRSLPQKSSAEPGRWRTDRTPYLREIMDSLSVNSTVEEVVFMKGAQVGGTEAIINVIGYAIAGSHGPILAVQPTVELAKRYSRQRIDPLVTSTPTVRDKVAEPRSRDSGNTVLSKDFIGGILVITGANSAVGLRSMPVRWLLLDEIDAYEASVDNEGSPIELAEARQRTFARRKRIKVSTPTIDGVSNIQDAWEKSDQRKYHVPCPACGELQPLEWESLRWTDLARPPDLAAYVCLACGRAIENHEKTRMLAQGEWRAAFPERSKKIRGYHLSALYSPVGWLGWGDIATQWVSDHKDPQRRRVFWNTMLGRVWMQRGDAVDWELLYRRREPYPIGSVPKGALYLTAGVDVQKDRLVYEVVGWGRRKESWSIDAGILPGDVTDPDGPAWAGLTSVLGRTFQNAAGVDYTIRVMAVDSGAFTQSVYAWVRQTHRRNVIAIKGRDTGSSLLMPPNVVDVNFRGKPVPGGYRVWNVVGPIAKEELNGWLHLQADAVTGETPPGFCHFPEYGEDFFKELTAEALVEHTRNGRTTHVWTILPGRANHYLDARVYCRAAANFLGALNLDRMTDAMFAQLEAETRQAEIPGPAYVVPPPPPPAGRPAATPEGSSVVVPPRPQTWIQPNRNWLRR